MHGWLEPWFDGDGRDEPVDDGVTQITGLADLERALDEPLAVIYKHSPRCGISNWAHVEIKQFAHDHPDAAVFMIDVIRHRGVSDAVGQRLGIPHESPQVLLLRNGRPAWHGSHGGVSATALRKHLHHPTDSPEPTSR